MPTKEKEKGWNRIHFTGFPLCVRSTGPVRAQWKSPVILNLPMRVKSHASTGSRSYRSMSFPCCHVSYVVRVWVPPATPLANVWCWGNSLEFTPDCVCERGTEPQLSASRKLFNVSMAKHKLSDVTMELILVRWGLTTLLWRDCIALRLEK